MHEDRPIKDRGRNFFLYISFPVAQRAYFPFSLKAVSAWLGLKMAHQTKEQSRQNKAEWSILRREKEPPDRAVLFERDG